MTILWINLIVVFTLSFFSRSFATRSIVGPLYIKPNKGLMIFVLLTMVCVSGLRNTIGDTYYYMFAYSQNDINWAYVQANKDMGFSVLEMLLQKISHDPQLMVFVTALITNVLIVVSFYKYSRFIELSLYVYITSGMFLISMNGIRQCLAAAIVFTGTKYIMDGNWKKYFLVVLIGSTFHSSALILIPLYFILRRPAWTRSTYVILILAIIFVIGYNQISEILFSAIQDTHYSEYQTLKSQGSSVTRAIVVLVPTVVAFFGREKLKKIFPMSDCIVNMSIMNSVFTVIATQNWIYNRFTIYSGLYSVLLISWQVQLFSNKDRKLVYYLILLFYLIFFYYEEVVSLGIIYKSSFF